MKREMRQDVALRAEVIRQLGGDDSPGCRTLLTRALADPAVEVRSAALSAVLGFVVRKK